MFDGVDEFSEIVLNLRYPHHYSCGAACSTIDQTEEREGAMSHNENCRLLFPMISD